MIKGGLVVWHLLAAAAHLVAVWTLLRPDDRWRAAEEAERIVRRQG